MLQRQQFCSLHMRRAAFGVPPHQDSQRLWRLQVLLAPQASQNFRLTLRCSFSAAFMSNIFLKDSRSEREAIDSRVTSGPRPNRKSKDAAQKYSDPGGKFLTVTDKQFGGVPVFLRTVEVGEQEGRKNSPKMTLIGYT